MVDSEFRFLFDLALKKEKCDLIVANGIDEASLVASVRAAQLGLVNITITGNRNDVCKQLILFRQDPDAFNIIDCSDDIEAIDAAVALAGKGRNKILMKGMVPTNLLMKSILNKKNGIMNKGSLLSHITMMMIPGYHKALLVSDVAIIPMPTIEQKEIIISNLINASHKLGVKIPKIAFIAATEKIMSAMPATTDAAILKEMWEQGAFPESICDGPMALDAAFDSNSAKLKGIASKVAGDVDCLLFPNIEAGNVFYKANTKLFKSKVAALVTGTNVPTVLSSRGDNIATKLNSIALAITIA